MPIWIGLEWIAEQEERMDTYQEGQKNSTCCRQLQTSTEPILPPPCQFPKKRRKFLSRVGEGLTPPPPRMQGQKKESEMWSVALNRCKSPKYEVEIWEWTIGIAVFDYDSCTTDQRSVLVQTSPVTTFRTTEKYSLCIRPYREVRPALPFSRRTNCVS